MEKTGIIWTEHTWNCIRARNKQKPDGKPGWFCTKVNEGCRFCYAEELNMKFGNGLSYEYPDLKHVEFYMAAQNDPFKWHKKSGPALIFPCSMTDLFHDAIPDKFRHEVFDIMEATPYHEYQVLTKRPDQMFYFSQKRALPKNLWAGMTIPDDKARRNGGLEYLHKTKAEIKWISLEPMISPVHFEADDLFSGPHYQGDSKLSVINQIIVGGESGKHLWKGNIAESRALVRYNYNTSKWEPREDRVSWVTDIRDTCAMHGISFFFKQWGGHYPEAGGRQLEGKTYNEIPRLPGGKDHINNEYLKKIEAEIGNRYGDNLELFEKE